MLYLIEPQHALAFIAGLLALALWLHAYLRNAPGGSNSASLMIPVSNLLAYLIGPVALTQPPWMVVAVSVTAVILLGTREQLHRLIEVVPQDELLTAGKFLILIGIILPLVPHQPITAATTLTPYHVWLAVVAVCTLSYMSYLLQKYVSCTKRRVAASNPRWTLLFDGHNGCSREAPAGSRPALAPTLQLALLLQRRSCTCAWA